MYFRSRTLSLCILSLAFLAFCCSVQAQERPNILFIIADDASRDSMGVYGCKYIKTPNFDRIAREGVRFEQAYNCNPKCAPARACLLTGRYSWQLAEACNHNPILSDAWEFFPFLLEDAGYFVGFTGKGWGPGIYQDVDAGKSKFKQKNPAGYPFNSANLVPPYKGISRTDYGANFDTFLEAKPEGQPFCFWLGTREPHRGYEKDSWQKDGRDLTQVDVPAYYPDNDTIRGDLADYAIEVEWYDKWIGKALESLESRGELENTLILVTSDHGMPFPRVKGQIYEDGFHVPFVARWGAKIKPGRVVTDFITFPDVAPTILEAAGIARHPQMTGKSFHQQLTASQSGRIDKQRDHTLLGKERHDIGRTDGELLSVGYPSRAIRTDNYLYVRNFKPKRWPGGDPDYGLLNCDNSPTKSFLTGLSQADPDYRFYQMSFGKRPAEELYEIGTDPDCVRNLANERQYQATKAQLWLQLRDELTAQGDPRVLGQGDIFDFYPYSKIDRQQKLYGLPDYDPVKIFQQRYPANIQEPNIAPSSPPMGFSWEETDSKISLKRGNQVLLDYNKLAPPLPPTMDPIYLRSGFIHPVCTPSGVSVTDAYPEDHPHQNGIFAAWVKTTYAGKSVDFWNLAKGTGRVRHSRVLGKTNEGFRVELIHEARPAPKSTDAYIEVLREQWNIQVTESFKDGWAFDLQVTQTAITDEPLVIEKYRYGGVALRGPAEWIVTPPSKANKFRFLNNRGSNRINGNHEAATWVCLTGETSTLNQNVSVAVLSHPSNFRAPQTARLHPTKPYFCFAPCVTQKFVIDRDHPYSAAYRYLVFDGEPNAAWIDQQYSDWAKETR